MTSFITVVLRILQFFLPNFLFDNNRKYKDDDVNSEENSSSIDDELLKHKKKKIVEDNIELEPSGDMSELPETEDPPSIEIIPASARDLTSIGINDESKDTDNTDDHSSSNELKNCIGTKEKIPLDKEDTVETLIEKDSVHYDGADKDINSDNDNHINNDDNYADLDDHNGIDDKKETEVIPIYKLDHEIAEIVDDVININNNNDNNNTDNRNNIDINSNNDNNINNNDKDDNNNNNNNSDNVKTINGPLIESCVTEGVSEDLGLETHTKNSEIDVADDVDLVEKDDTENSQIDNNGIVENDTINGEKVDGIDSCYDENNISYDVDGSSNSYSSDDNNTNHSVNTSHSVNPLYSDSLKHDEDNNKSILDDTTVDDYNSNYGESHDDHMNDIEQKLLDMMNSNEMFGDDDDNDDEEDTRRGTEAYDNESSILDEMLEEEQQYQRLERFQHDQEHADHGAEPAITYESEMLKYEKNYAIEQKRKEDDPTRRTVKFANHDFHYLTEAIRDENLEILKNCDASHIHENGKSLLHLAAYDGKLEVCKLLLEDIDPNEKDPNGVTPLHTASWRGWVDICKLLCDSGADVNMVDLQSRSALHYAVRNVSSPLNGMDTHGVIITLVERGIDINLADCYQHTALHVAMHSCKLTLSTLLYLHDHGLEINLIDDDGHSPLFSAVRSGDVEYVGFLINNGAYLDITDVNGETVFDVLSKQQKIIEDRINSAIEDDQDMMDADDAIYEDEELLKDFDAIVDILSSALGYDTDDSEFYDDENIEQEDDEEYGYENDSEFEDESHDDNHAIRDEDCHGSNNMDDDVYDDNIDMNVDEEELTDMVNVNSNSLDEDEMQ